MSTKIYYAWRIPVRYINHFTDLLHDEMYKNAEELITSTFDASNITKGNFSEKIDAFFNLFKEAAKSPYKNGLDVECAFNIWFHNAYVYIIPIAPSNFFKNFKKPRYAKDYSYWDNADCPENVSFKEWEERGKIWEQINCGTGKSDHNARRFCHEVINIKDKFYFDFKITEKLRKLYNKKDTILCRNST